MAVRVILPQLAGVSKRWVAGWAKKTAKALGRPNDDVAINFLSAKAIQKLNREYRKKNQATDVLSFPSGMEDDLGDVFISPAVAKVKAAGRGESYCDYLALLIVHSVLHLDGYDHHTEKESVAMARMEKKILNQD
jgi:probable rRNA maturation factor